MAVWSTAYINDLPDSAFLYIEPGGSKDSEGKTTPRSLRHFPYKDASGNVDLPHLRNALSRIPQSNLSSDLKARLTTKAQRILGSDRSESMTTIAVRDGEFRFEGAHESLFELRDGDAGPTLIGHFAVFDQWAEINSRFEGNFIERIAPGAFRKTFAENRSNMRVLFQHGKDFLGEQILGKIQSLEEDGRGARYEVSLYDGVPPLIMNGLRDNAYGASFRFRAMKEDWNDSPDRSTYNPDGLRERTITEAKVMEFGPVTFPAYPGSTAGLRSITDWWHAKSLEAQLAELGFSPTLDRAAALETEEPAPEPDPEPEPDEPSRRTRSFDHLSTREEDKPWRL